MLASIGRKFVMTSVIGILIILMCNFLTVHLSRCTNEIGNIHDLEEDKLVLTILWGGVLLTDPIRKGLLFLRFKLLSIARL